MAQGGLSYSILNHLLGHSWPLFIKFIKPFYLKKGDTAVLAHRSFHKELNFGGEHSQIETPFFDFGTDRLPLRGSIDSLDVFEGGYLLMDYKRKFVPTQKQQKNLEDSQLLFYAMVYKRLFPMSSFAGGISGYWSIIEGKWYPRSVGSSYLFQEKFPQLKIPNKESLEQNTDFF